MLVEASWNGMAHAQKPDFIFRRNGRVYLNRRGHQFSRLLAAELCASAVVLLDTPCSEVVWRVLATHYIHQFPLHFPFRASSCAITFQLESTTALKLKTFNLHTDLLSGCLSLSLFLPLSLLNGCTVEHSSITTPHTCQVVCACVLAWMYLYCAYVVFCPTY